MVNVATKSPISFISEHFLLSSLEEKKKDLTGNKELAGELKMINSGIKSIKKIEACVNGSSNKSILSMLVYRIWNAVKFCFGMSDRQQARRAINNLKNMCLKQKDLFFDKKNGFTVLDAVFTKSDQKNIIKNGSDFLLDLLIGLNNNEAIKACTTMLQIEEKLALLDDSELSAPEVVQKPQDLEGKKAELLSNLEKDKKVSILMQTLEMEAEDIKDLPKVVFEKIEGIFKSFFDSSSSTSE